MLQRAIKQNLQPKILITVLWFCCAATLVSAQLVEYPTLALTLPLTSIGGTNGSAVAYNPDKKLYYAVIAGNVTFPLETFDAAGNSVHLTTTNFDARGLWWQPDTKQLISNGYYDFGIEAYKLAKNGLPSKAQQQSETSGQPDAQSVGAFDTKNNHILYYQNGVLYKVDATSYEPVEEIPLQIPVDLEYLNYTTVIYTGVEGKEVGVLDFENKKVYLFDINSGQHTFTIHLPSTAITNDAFRFSYANGYIWLYDIESRVWYGYKGFLA